MNTQNKTVHLCFCTQLAVSHVQKIDKTRALPNFKTFFSGIQATEKLPVTLYIAGSFVDEWQKGWRQGYSLLINDLVSRKQIELLTGGYYQPYLSILPASDVVGQIELLTTAIRTKFSKKPRGLFLTGSAWNPALITPFSKCGMEYCLLDSRFFTSGCKAGELGNYPFSPVILEDNGKTITAVPYMWGDTAIIKQSPKAFYQKITDAAPNNTHSIYVLFLPVNTFIKGFEKSKDSMSWFSCLTEICAKPHSAIKLCNTASLPSLRKNAIRSYIPPNTILKDTTTGYSAKQIITEDPPAFQLYTKMMYIHMLANGVKGDKARKKYALQEFWKAQSAEFFTLDEQYKPYRRYLRRIAYRNLLVAEKHTRLPGAFTNSLTRYDIDLDGSKEFLSQRNCVNMYVHQHGGKIFECDIFSAYKNYLDMPLPDPGMFIDNLLSDAALENLQAGLPDHIPAVFSDNTYKETVCDTIHSILKLSTSGFFGTIMQPVSLIKQYTFFNEGSKVQYIVKNDSPFNLSSYFAVEVDIAVEEDEHNQFSLLIYNHCGKQTCKTETASFTEVSCIRLEDFEGKVYFSLEANEVPDMTIIPVYGKGADPICKKELRGLRTFFYWKIDLNPGYETEKILTLEVKGKKNSERIF